MDADAGFSAAAFEAWMSPGTAAPRSRAKVRPRRYRRGETRRDGGERAGSNSDPADRGAEAHDAAAIEDDGGAKRAAKRTDAGPTQSLASRRGFELGSRGSRREALPARELTFENEDLPPAPGPAPGPDGFLPREKRSSASTSYSSRVWRYFGGGSSKAKAEAEDVSGAATGGAAPSAGSPGSPDTPPRDESGPASASAPVARLITPVGGGSGGLARRGGGAEALASENAALAAQLSAAMAQLAATAEVVAAREAQLASAAKMAALQCDELKDREFAVARLSAALEREKRRAARLEEALQSYADAEAELSFETRVVPTEEEPEDGEGDGGRREDGGEGGRGGRVEVTLEGETAPPGG